MITPREDPDSSNNKLQWEWQKVRDQAASIKFSEYDFKEQMEFSNTAGKAVAQVIPSNMDNGGTFGNKTYEVESANGSGSGGAPNKQVKGVPGIAIK